MLTERRRVETLMYTARRSPRITNAGEYIVLALIFTDAVLIALKQISVKYL